MMKKTLALVLTTLLLLCAFSASAETIRFVENSSDFDISLPLPEGATVVSQEGIGDLSIVTIAKEGLATVRISIAPTDIYDKESMNDLSDEDIEALKQISAEAFEDPLITIDQTLQGNKYFYVCANSDDNDIDTIFTLYKGYFIELTQWHDDNAKVTDADLAFMKQMLYDLEFKDLK